MAPLESRKIKATERLLLKYPASFETVNEFEQYMKDIALVTNPTPELTQQARAAFAKNMQQKQGNRTSIYNLQTRERAISKSLKYWLFDFAVLIAIVSVLISVFGIRYKQHESIQQDPVKPEVQVSTPCTPSTPMTQLYQVSDYVEVFDPSLNYPLRIPWEIKDIYTKDGIVKFQLQRMVSNRKSHLVLENVDASTIVKSQPYGRHTKAMCELDMKIHPCVSLYYYHSIHDYRVLNNCCWNCTRLSLTWKTTRYPVDCTQWCLTTMVEINSSIGHTGLYGGSWIQLPLIMCHLL